MTAEQFLTPNGWADDRLMQAYDLIWEVEQVNEALGISREFGMVRAAIEMVSADLAQSLADAAEYAPQALADELAETLDRETGRG